VIGPADEGGLSKTLTPSLLCIPYALIESIGVRGLISCLSFTSDYAMDLSEVKFPVGFLGF
jgi:hypothetical protein